MPRITINLRERAFEKLQRVALAERRPTRDQAAWIVEQALESIGGERTEGRRPEPPRCDDDDR